MEPIYKRTNELNSKATSDRLQRLCEATDMPEMRQACYHLITLLPIIKVPLTSLLKYIHNMPDKEYASYLLQALRLAGVEKVK